MYCSLNFSAKDGVVILCVCLGAVQYRWISIGLVVVQLRAVSVYRYIKKAKENWIGEQCSEIEENLRKNNSKRAYELVKELTTVKHGKVTSVQDRSGKCLTEERQILNRWTEYCSELYNHKANGDPSVLNCT